MKALVMRRYGGPEAMELADLPEPDLQPGDILVDVHAASINPIDWKMREGMLRHFFDVAFPRVLGRDFSGVVAATAAEVTNLAPGDAVFGVANAIRGGTHAQRIAIEAGLVARKPDRVDHAGAAALGVSGITVMAALDEAVTLSGGETVVVHAAAGGVGHIAVQFAKHRGCRVLGTASERNFPILRDLGCDALFDYRKPLPQDLAADIVLDTMGGDVHRQSQALLRPGGTLVYINAAPLPDTAPRADIEIRNATVRGGRAVLEKLAALVDAGAIRPWVETLLPLDRAAEGYALGQQGKARGKTVLALR